MSTVIDTAGIPLQMSVAQLAELSGEEERVIRALQTVGIIAPTSHRKPLMFLRSCLLRVACFRAAQ